MVLIYISFLQFSFVNVDKSLFCRLIFVTNPESLSFSKNLLWSVLRIVMGMEIASQGYATVSRAFWGQTAPEVKTQTQTHPARKVLLLAGLLAGPLSLHCVSVCSLTASSRCHVCDLTDHPSIPK